MYHVVDTSLPGWGSSFAVTCWVVDISDARPVMEHWTGEPILSTSSNLAGMAVVLLRLRLMEPLVDWPSTILSASANPETCTPPAYRRPTSM